MGAEVFIQQPVATTREVVKQIPKVSMNYNERVVEMRSQTQAETVVQDRSVFLGTQSTGQYLQPKGVARGMVEVDKVNAFGQVVERDLVGGAVGVGGAAYAPGVGVGGVAYGAGVGVGGVAYGAGAFGGYGARGLVETVAPAVGGGIVETIAPAP